MSDPDLDRPEDPATERPQDVGPPADPAPPSINLVGVFKALARLLGG